MSIPFTTNPPKHIYIICQHQCPLWFWHIFIWTKLGFQQEETQLPRSGTPRTPSSKPAGPCCCTEIPRAALPRCWPRTVYRGHGQTPTGESYGKFVRKVEVRYNPRKIVMIHFWGILLGGTIARSHAPFILNTPVRDTHNCCWGIQVWNRYRMTQISSFWWCFFRVSPALSNYGDPLRKTRNLVSSM